MKYLKYVVALLAILGAFISFSVRYWATDQFYSAEGPSFVRVRPDQSISILIGNKIFSFDQSGQHKSTVGFSSLGLKISGDFAYFPNGDLLFYNFPSEMNFVDSVISFFRIRDNSDTSNVEGEGFLRCRPTGLDCQPFTSQMPALRGHAFGIDIDQQTSDVYVSATEKFKIFKFNSQGRLLAENAEDLWFPNTIRLLEGNLYIADTNHHRIKVVETSDSEFGNLVEAFPAELEGTSYRWPSGIEYGEGAWWVLLSGSNMAWGEVLRYSSDWSTFKQLELPEGTWPLGMAFYNGTVWIADYEQMVLYRFSSDGERLTDFENSVLEAEYAEIHTKREKYERVAGYGLWGMILFLVCGIVGVYFLDKENSQKAFRERREANKPFNPDDYMPPSFEGNQPNWYRPRKYKELKIGVWLFRLMPVLLIASFIPLLINDEIGEKLPSLSLIFFLIGFVGGMILLERLFSDIAFTELGVHPKGLLIRRKGHIITQRRFEDIYHTDSHFFIGNRLLMLGSQTQGGIFDPNVVEGYVRPRLSEEKKLSPVKAFYYLLSIGDFMTYSFLILFVFFLTIIPMQ